MSVFMMQHVAALHVSKCVWVSAVKWVCFYLIWEVFPIVASWELLPNQRPQLNNLTRLWFMSSCEQLNCRSLQNELSHRFFITCCWMGSAERLTLPRNREGGGGTYMKSAITVFLSLFLHSSLLWRQRFNRLAEAARCKPKQEIQSRLIAWKPRLIVLITIITAIKDCRRARDERKKRRRLTATRPE